MAAGGLPDATEGDMVRPMHRRTHPQLPEIRWNLQFFRTGALVRRIRSCSGV